MVRGKDLKPCAVIQVYFSSSQYIVDKIIFCQSRHPALLTRKALPIIALLLPSGCVGGDWWREGSLTNLLFGVN